MADVKPRINARAKGKAGEREAADVLTGYIGHLFIAAGHPVPELSRNLQQTREGGYDIDGLPWLAIEVKRVESEFQPAWWAQVMKARRPGQAAVVMYRRNLRPWRFRVTVWTLVSTDLSKGCLLAVDMAAAEFKAWLSDNCYAHLHGQGLYYG